MKKIILIVVAVLVLLVAAVVGTLFFTGAFSHAPEAAAGQAQAESAPAVVLAEPQYFVFEPSFVVNIDDGMGTRYLQLEMSLMYREKTTVERVNKFMPPIRNDIVMILSSKNREQLRSSEGRMALQAELLDAINNILTTNTGLGGVEQVYFTKFVIQ